MALSPDRKVVKFDFSAAELVIMAAMSGDKTLINAFRQGVDPHKAVYSQMTGKPVVQLSKEEREKGKTLNYGMMYGGTEFTLARQLGISTEEARELRSKYLDSVPQVGELVSKIQKECLDTTYTKTIMGRRRRLPEVKSADQAAVAKALRQSVNTCCQSSCGDLLKQAMVDIQSEMDKDSKWQGVQLICPVFDAAAYSVPRDLVSDFKELLQRVAPRHLPVATGGELELKVVVEVGDNWGFEEFEPPEDEDEGEN
jgi:DNA polymerase-1